MLCIPISAASNAEMRHLLRQAADEPADLHELRLDALTEPPEVEELVAASTRPVIATCRSTAEGGAFSGADGERRAILTRAARAGAAYIDAEAGDIPHLADRWGATLIVSMHDFQKTPDDLSARVAELAALPADWVKIAVQANNPADNLRVFNAIRACPKPCIGMAMGEMGLMSRILGPAHGSRVTFGSLAPGRESAPGQPTARELAALYRVGSITRETAVYGLLADPVAQSRGYILHNSIFAAMDFDAVYIPFLAHDARDFLDTVPEAVNVRGLSVSIPHKQAALSWATDVSDVAERIGAANTLTRGPEGWRADNTDCPAVFKVIKDKLDANNLNLVGAPALLLGTGGAARAIGTALTLLGCRVAVSGRNATKTFALADAMRWDHITWKDAPDGQWALVANSTPVGMYPDVDDTPFPASAWRPGMVAFDAVANPAETRFLREAMQAGALAVSGEEMFRLQAEGQLRLWTRRENIGAQGVL